MCITHPLQDKLDTIRLLVIGVSAHQKLELLERLVTQLGYDSLTVFGDCFDEVRDATLMAWTAAALQNWRRWQPTGMWLSLCQGTTWALQAWSYLATLDSN